MQTYFITVEEVRRKVVAVNADTGIGAVMKVRSAYENCEICLDDEKYILDGAAITDETDFWKKASKTIKAGFHVIEDCDENMADIDKEKDHA